MGREEIYRRIHHQAPDELDDELEDDELELDDDECHRHHQGIGRGIIRRPPHHQEPDEEEEEEDDDDDHHHQPEPDELEDDELELEDDELELEDDELELEDDELELEDDELELEDDELELEDDELELEDDELELEDDELELEDDDEPTTALNVPVYSPALKAKTPPLVSMLASVFANTLAGPDRGPIFESMSHVAKVSFWGPVIRSELPPRLKPTPPALPPSQVARTA